MKYHFFLISLAVLLISLYFEVYHQLATSIWTSDEQGHGPIILLISLFLFWQKRHLLASKQLQSDFNLVPFVFLFLSLVIYLIGSILNILVVEVASQVFLIASLILMFYGVSTLRLLMFPIFFLVFLVPLPGFVVDALTLPMKMAVSNFVEFILYYLDYPIARSGVILQIGYYKLLVADACAGLHTVFTLEAMGLLYLHLVRRDSFFRNVTLAVLIIPISFFANSVRVVILVLVTFYFGDDVGQGFIHDFAGFVLFASALVFIIATDILIQKIETIRATRKLS